MDLIIFFNMQFRHFANKVGNLERPFLKDFFPRWVGSCGCPVLRYKIRIYSLLFISFLEFFLLMYSDELLAVAKDGVFL